MTNIDNAAKRMAAEYQLYRLIADNKAKLVSLGKVKAIRFIQDTLGIDDYVYTKYQLQTALKANGISFMRPKAKAKVNTSSAEIRDLAREVLSLILDINSILSLEVGTCINEEALEPLRKMVAYKKQLETIK
jgi:hypothetical protein